MLPSSRGLKFSLLDSPCIIIFRYYNQLFDFQSLFVKKFYVISMIPSTQFKREKIPFNYVTKDIEYQNIYLMLAHLRCLK